jgi:OOP family OmpA-OmpF porin
MKNIIRAAICLAAWTGYGNSMQSQVQYSDYEIGLGGTSFVYQGDLVPSATGSYRTLKNGLSFFGTKILSSSFSIRANMSIGRIAGDDSKFSLPAWRKQRNFSFHSPVAELTALLTWNVLGKNDEPFGFAPYLFAGAGFSYLHITRDASGFNGEFFSSEPAVVAGLAADLAHRLPRITPVIPVGAGIRYALSSRFSVYAETSYRFMFSDYIDGFSQAANPAKNDHYYTNSIGLIYRMTKKNTLKCPTIKN